ncbi:hypothetical protein H6G06_21840 [Anabaena sphaerica FACHB-251]|uniref:Uncharacterized protein n=1 Tax=Anabaena sphaerica FACHB-251 TaxID=2692883 RepID=A0A927A424_9NOST|nr:hypothetical protein [Anabaena sphaerica]MBD2296045.1 hypothetical protein [Anabaena sphaerica FACHB-251]
MTNIIWDKLYQIFQSYVALKPGENLQQWEHELARKCCQDIEIQVTH